MLALPKQGTCSTIAAQADNKKKRFITGTAGCDGEAAPLLASLRGLAVLLALHLEF